MSWTQIADDGGLLPFPITRDTFELWPAKRREHIVDFTKYKDGSPTKKGDVIYLTNVMRMPDGRMWTNSSRFLPDPKYKIPMMKIVIGDDAPDDSVPARPDHEAAGPPAAAVELEDPARRPADLRGPARLRRRRARVADQRQAVRPDGRAHSLKNKAGHRTRRRRRRTPSTSGRSATAAAAGCTPSTCTWKSTGPSCGTTRTSP